ncbi:MAG: TonB-dependent receptor [Rhodospirillaceae bacterium]|nr:TonB-dependent receptor [Rhodospirillaceae bacterium]
MSDRSKFGRAWLLASASTVAVGLGSSVAFGQGTEQTAAAVEEIVVTGSRFGGRIVTESPTPIDLVSGTELQRGGQVQLQNILKTAVPSFSMSQPATAGTLDFTSTPALRGLGPGELLLMVNGKRRHSTGILNNNNQIGRGDVGYDFSAIPTEAIGRVEVLRDGASAQYGADAISGVINIVLDKSLGSNVSVMSGVMTEGDGFVVEVNGSHGFQIGSDGVLRLTARYQNRNGTNRAEPDTRQQYFGSNGTRTISNFFGSGTGLTPANGTLDPREATINRNVFQLGDPKFNVPSVFANLELPTSDNVTVYGFGGYSALDGRNPNFFRRAGQNETVRALHPNGFRPDNIVDMDNVSATGGVRGDDIGGFGWDLSTQYGKSIIDQANIDSNNVSLGAASPTTAYNSGVRFSQWTTNFDLTREIDIDGDSPLQVAAGAEYREEYYRVIAGELASYVNGGVRIIDGPNAGGLAPVGFQPSPGLTPDDATKQNRHSAAIYAQVDKEFAGRFLVSGAVRYEDFSDFGDSTTYKIASRFEVTDPFALRASYSTGFRAPHLAQSYYSSTSTTFLNGLPVTLRLFPVVNPVARALGATDLTPEKSKSFSGGAVYSAEGLSLSVDYYVIKLRDRMALSSTFQDVRVTNFLATRGFNAIGAVSYMTNAIDTKTQGVDFTSRYNFDLGDMGELMATFAANYNKTKFNRIAPTPAALSALGITVPLFDLTQQVRLTSASPKDKYNLDLTWNWNDLSVNVKNTRYGRVKSMAFTSLTPAQIAVLTPGYNVELFPTVPAGANSQVVQTFGSEILTDIGITYEYSDASFTIGVNNAFDVYPDKNITSTVASVAAGTNGSDNSGTFPYNYVSPFGYNGRFIYGKISYRF